MMQKEQECWSECQIHDTDEEMVPGGIICSECWHAYPTLEDLLKEWKELNENVFANTGNSHYKEVAEKAMTLELKQIPFCPTCLHDYWRPTIIGS